MENTIQKNRRFCSLVLILLVVICGCSTTQKQAVPDRFEKWRVMAKTSPKLTPDPGPMDGQMDKKSPSPEKAIDSNETTLPQEPQALPERPLPVMPLTMKMHDVDVAVLLRTLARAADMNILINESVTGQAKVNFENVPWDQAFTGILDTYGLTYQWRGDILRIITVEDLSKEIALMEAKQKYQKSKREHDLAMKQMAKKEEAIGPLETRVVKINFADLTELRQNLETYLMADSNQGVRLNTGAGPSDASQDGFRGAILKDQTTNSLIIQATKPDMDRILPIIAKIDRPSRQVLIEAHIVEATSETAKELGIQWGGLATDGKNWIGGDRKDFTSKAWDDDGNSSLSGNIVNQAIESTGGGSLGMMIQSFGKYALYAQLTALEADGKLHILSKPSITTLDHHKASIESGRDVPFQTVEDDEVNIEWRKAVISLEVTPHVINEKIVRLEIITHKDELDFTDTVEGNPTIITKNAQTMVNLFDGQTTVIGGLNKELVEESESGVPWFKDIQGLGWLFKGNKDGAEMEELLIFITPHILEKKTLEQSSSDNG